uniref:G-protein coupled receptors family 1 profile domain-containing protein n=1 Tax=Meloidogyne enterolobii TaxID=390850 RepID=A0A6V7WY97_MELEN|nr:unnamed protein product [Meloidogyne enterolobii]
MNQMFYGTGPSAWLITLFGIKVIISIVGSTLNGTLAYVILRNKSMNSLCNKLIACYSIGSIFQQLNFFVTFVTVITGNNFISYKTCVLIQLLPIFFSFFSFPLTFFIAIERFLAIFFPIWYKKRNGNNFLIIILFCCFVLGSYVTSVDIITSFGNPNILVICAIGPKIDASLVNYLILGMNFGSICAYLAVWIRIKFAVGNYTDYQTHLLKCLFVLLLLELFGWTFSVGLRVFIGPLFGIVSGTFLNFLIINLATNIAYIAIALNLPVLHTFSKEHRAALNKHWVKIKAILRLSTVHATGVQPANAVFVVPNAISRQQTSSQSLKTHGRVYSRAM